MKSFLYLMAFLLIFTPDIFSQRAKIQTEAVTRRQLTELGITTNSVSPGLDNFANETYIYFSAKNIGNTQPILTANFELIQKPSGSTTVLESLTDPLWTMFKADRKGTYVLKLTITTASGTHDTTKTLYSSDFVGVGNFGGAPAQYPNCMTCHQNTDRFVEIYNRWNNSAHAQTLKKNISFGPASFNQNCFSCHTTGTDNLLAANNKGFDDVAQELGWAMTGTPRPAIWDSLTTHFQPLVSRANVGCESCHGAGSEHTLGGNPGKIAIELTAGVCGQCHDSPEKSNTFIQWQQATHARALWSNSFAQTAASQNNNLQNCIRCHDAQGYVNFTKNLTTNTTGWTINNHVTLTCATCHDPHGNDNHASLRRSPVTSDTLANGFAYEYGRAGHLCMDCHKARREAESYSLTQVTNANWGPHYSSETDNYFGQNAASFGSAYLSSPHMYAVENSCVTCHMGATPASGDPNRHKVGGHTFKLKNEETGFHLTTTCTPCHGNKTSWDDFMARSDYDGNGIKESIPTEIEGLLTNLRMALPPIGIDSISWQGIRDSNNLDYRKAFFNYQLISKGAAYGMHNTAFAIDVLQKSTAAIGGFVSSVNLEEDFKPVHFRLFQNYPNPFNPTTTIKYNLMNESKVKLTVFNLTGEQVAELVNTVQTNGDYTVNFNANNLASGIYFYRIEITPSQDNRTYVETKKMLLMK